MSDMPTTPVYGLPHERGVTLPGRTLTGGPTGDDPILAEAVEAELIALRGQLESLRQEVAQMPQILDRGFITESTDNTGITISLPTGPWAHLRLTLRGHCSALTQVACRVNGDSTNMYMGGRITRQASDGSVASTHYNDSGSMWLMGEWSTLSANNAAIEFFSSGPDLFVGMQARVARMSANNVNHRISDSWGRITEHRTMTSINIRTNTVGEGYDYLHWQLVGVKAP